MTVSFSQSTETAASQQDKNPNSLQFFNDTATTEIYTY